MTTKTKQSCCLLNGKKQINKDYDLIHSEPCLGTDSKNKWGRELVSVSSQDDPLTHQSIIKVNK